MKNKLLFLVVIVLIGVYYLGSIQQDTSFLKENDKIVAIKDTKTEAVEEYNIEDYLIGVLAGEMPASFNIEALKAQAVASRSFAYYKIRNSNEEYDLTNDTSSQVHLTDAQMHEKWGNDYEKYLTIIKKAVKETKNEVMVYDNKIIAAYYFSMSNGYTEDGALVFNENKDYLKSVSSKSDENNPNFLVTKELTKEEFCNKLNIICDEIIINDIVRSSSNRVQSIKINNKTFSGIDIRWILDLRSTDFDIEINDNIKITTKGYGHGVGMSQYGANNMAEIGSSYKEILEYYYTGARIKDIDSII